MSTVISQLTCSTTLRRHNHLQFDRRSNLPRPKFSVVVSLERPNVEACRLGNKLNLRYASYLTRPSTNETAETYPVTKEPVDEKVGINGPVEPILNEKKWGAMIHDFYFGIPFGDFVLAAGLIGFIFSRNVATLTTNVLFGGSLLTLSLKIKQLLPSGVYALLSAAMLCFFSYVVIARGNPPPKKQKSNANYAS